MKDFSFTLRLLTNPAVSPLGLYAKSEETREKQTETTDKEPAVGPLAPLPEEQGHFLDVLANGGKEALLRYSGKPPHPFVAKSVQLFRIRETPLDRLFPPFVKRFSPFT